MTTILQSKVRGCDMKFDPFKWDEVKADGKNYCEKGVLRLRCSREVALFVEAQGLEALVGVGTSFEVEVSQAVTWWAEPVGKPARLFIHVPRNGVVIPQDEVVFTNIDRMVDESGPIMEVRRALRELEISRRAALREIAEARADVRLPVGPGARDALLVEPIEPAVPS